MSEKEKSDLQKFIDGDYDGIPIDAEKIKKRIIDTSDDPDFDFSKKLGFTDNLYLDTGIDLRWLKRFNPRNHVIF